MSAALSGTQFCQLVLEAEEKNKLVNACSSASEFADILEQVVDRAIQPPSHASDGFMLFEGGFNNRVQVRALSPSPATVLEANKSIAELLLANSKTGKLCKLDPNDLSVAVQVCTEAQNLLLKADLENSKNQLAGWNAVLNSTLRPGSKSEIVKVGHHGSANADNEDVWKQLIDSGPTSVVTPYSRTPLPSTKDVERIKSRGTSLYATTWPPKSKPPRRQGVDGLVNSATRSRHTTNRRPGFIRIRFSLSSPGKPHTTESFGSAREL